MLNFIYSQNIGPNLYRIYLGGYRTRAEAEQRATVLQSKGYIDAMVQQIDLSQGNQVRVIQLGVKIDNMDETFFIEKNYARKTKDETFWCFRRCFENGWSHIIALLFLGAIIVVYGYFVF